MAMVDETGADEIARMDLDTQLVRGGRNNPFIDRSHHMNLRCLLADHVRRRGGDHNLVWATATARRRAATSSRQRTAFEPSGAAASVTPAEIETYDTPFSFENEVTHQWAFINDTWTVGRFSINGGVRLDSFKPYYEEQGNRVGAVSGGVTYPGFEFHS